jgi:hypothetical protein
MEMDDTIAPDEDATNWKQVHTIVVLIELTLPPLSENADVRQEIQLRTLGSCKEITSCPKAGI